MFGAIIGDIVESRPNFKENGQGKGFEFFHRDCRFTGTTILTIATYLALKVSRKGFDDLGTIVEPVTRAIGLQYPIDCYDMDSMSWIIEGNQHGLEQSSGNAAAARISAVPYFAESMEDLERLTLNIAAPTHCTPEGLNGAVAVASAIFLALRRKTKDEIRDYICKVYPQFTFPLSETEPRECKEDICSITIPQALTAFYDSTSFEDAVRNAVAVGGNKGSLVAITGSIAEAYYGLSEEMIAKAYRYLDPNLAEVVEDFEYRYYETEDDEN